MMLVEKETVMCKNCGGEGEFQLDYNVYNKRGIRIYFIHCKDCGKRVGPFMKKALALDKWEQT